MVILIHNLTESSLLRGVNFLAMMVIYSSVAVSSSLQRHLQDNPGQAAGPEPKDGPEKGSDRDSASRRPQARYSR